MGGREAQEGDNIYISNLARTHTHIGKEHACQCGRHWTRTRSLGWEDSLEEGMATQFGILVWRILMDRGAWQATVCLLGCRESDMTEVT